MKIDAKELMLGSDSLKQELQVLLASFDETSFLALVDHDGRVVRKLISLLYDQHIELRWQAVMAFGCLARHRPHLIQRTISRMAWSLNDEASTCGAFLAAALGEIAFWQIDLVRHVVRIVIHYIEDWEACHSHHRNVEVLSATLWAVARIARVEPLLVLEVVATLIKFLQDPEAQIRGQAWAVLMILQKDSFLQQHEPRQWQFIFDSLATLIDDPALFYFFNPDGPSIQTVSVGEMVTQWKNAVP